MGIEIERKFLVVGDDWRSLASGIPYRQGYILAAADGRTVRVRIADDQGFLTIKSGSEGISRLEFEYRIPTEEANQLLDALCDRPLIEKKRHRISWGDLVWEVDEFSGDNQGLIMAEVELPRADYPLSIPAWIGQEVSGDPRYFNTYLSKHPFTTW